MNAGVWTAILGGLCMDRYGARVTSLAALAMVGGGYTGMWLLTRLSDPPWWSFAVLGYTVGQGSYWCYTVALKTNVASYPASARGRVVGTLVAYVGLAAGIFAQFFAAFFNSVDFFLFLAVTQACPCLIGLFMTVQPASELRPGESRVLNGVNALAGVVAVLITVSAVLQATSDVDKLPFGIALAALCAMYPLLLLLDRDGHQTADAAAAAAKPGPPSGKGLGEAVRSVDFWLLFVVYLGLAGPGVMMCNNFTQYFISRNRDLVPGQTYVKKDGNPDIPHYGMISALVTIFAVSNTAGRIVAGYATDAGTKAGVHRSVLLVVVAVLMAGTQVLFAEANVPYVAAVPLGLAVGHTFAIVPMLVGEFFGMKAFAAIWAAETLAPTVGTLTLNGLLGARLEEHYSHDSFVWIKDKPDSDPAKYCRGDLCLRYALLIQAGICLLAAFAAAVVWCRHGRKASAAPQPSVQRDIDAASSDDDGSGPASDRQRLLRD
eukprot:TRINITY_DN11617_c0_g1_i2.p1 TRINITY_DN11617_c0_g1~~TRINITY_DN11617_c0_g1_i2.p1  ORF type:complete len:490 (+),score=143.92 TRINITY_DN11617_c0_g1_i2:255-1724(+)